ncbi:hypothetical protein R1sor_015822 [Riccia sorocarpa]|uniref:Myb-like domain-containing protein n=1 Tax=Riccia sorocarpa TaxID=122646 RepID=A0ABD3HDN9_9MARC
MEARRASSEFLADSGVPDSQNQTDFNLIGTHADFNVNAQQGFLRQKRPVPSTVWGNSQNFYMSRPVPVRPVSLPVVPNFGAGAAPMIHAPLFGMPNLGMMQNPSVPTGGLPPPGRDQRLPDSSPEGGPAQRRSSFGASAVRDGGIPAIGGHQPGPSAVPTAEFTPPGRDEHLPDSSPDGNPAEDDLGDGASDSDSEHEEVADDDADEEGNTGSRTYWRDFEVVFLIDAQRELQEFCNQLKGRKKKLLSKDEKWARVVETVTAKGVEKSKKQMQGKWKTLLQEHRKIRDHDKRSGEAPWASMDKATRRKKKLPLKFTDQWFALLDNFQGNRHINNPVCLESSSRVPVPEFSDPGNHSNPDLTDGVPAESRSGSLPAAAEARATSNSGVKRKKDVSRSASLLVEAIDRMSESSTTNMREVEKGRSDRETQRHQLTRELESSKQDRADQRTRILADVLSSMVSAISEMARSKRQHDAELVVLLLALYQLVYQIVVEFLQDEEDQTFDHEDMMTDSEDEADTNLQQTTVAVSTHSIIAARQYCEDGWWVKERNLMWFDYYLWQAFDEERWIRTLRMPKQLFQWVCTRLGPSIQKQDTRFRNAVPVEVRVGVTLFRLCTGSSYFNTGDRFGVGESTAHEIVEETVKAVVQVLGPEMVYWPRGTEMERVTAQFFRKCGLPNCQGAVDGSHIPIRGPGGDEHQGDYSNRKSFYSILLQAVCDADGVFLDTFVGLPGSVHDRRVLQVSPFFENVQRGVFLSEPTVTINGNYELRPYILGDAGYTQERWLMAPFNLTSRSSAKLRLYNERHVRGRLAIEQAFGILKARFKILETGITSSVTWAATLVQACCIFHNFLLKNRLQTLDRNVVDTDMRTRTAGSRVATEEDIPRRGNEVRNQLADYLLATS